MNVRAKFKVTEAELVKYYSDNKILQLKMDVVYNDGDPANAQWSKATPSGSLWMNVTNPDVFDSFQLGKFYYLDFSPVENDPS